MIIYFYANHERGEFYSVTYTKNLHLTNQTHPIYFGNKTNETSIINIIFLPMLYEDIKAFISSTYMHKYLYYLRKNLYREHKLDL